MREGGEAALCVLASCEAPEREGGGLARVDRLWRTFAGKEEASPAFDAVAAALAAK